MRSRGYSLALYSVTLYRGGMETTAPIKIVDATPFGKPSYYVAVGPRQLLAEAHAHRTPVTVETGDAAGDQIILLDYNPADPGHHAPYGLVKTWTAESGPYQGQEIAAYLVNTTPNRLTDAPRLAAHIAKRNSQILAATTKAEARAAAEEAELSRPAD